MRVILGATRLFDLAPGCRWQLFVLHRGHFPKQAEALIRAFDLCASRYRCQWLVRAAADGDFYAELSRRIRSNIVSAGCLERICDSFRFSGDGLRLPLPFGVVARDV